MNYFPNSKGDLTGQTEEETLYLSMDPEQTWIFPIQIMISEITRRMKIINDSYLSSEVEDINDIITVATLEQFYS